MSNTSHEPQPQALHEAASDVPQLLTLQQTAEQLQISRATLYRLIRKEGLPVQHLGRAVRVWPPALSAWLQQRQQHQAPCQSPPPCISRGKRRAPRQRPPASPHGWENQDPRGM
ncbi:helix-turn-helix domain-containing protein [Ktedonosporobacter rubrisoli]|nr:helix-turn-helix domain-containing protein [Ktedonosporobacter rubrisoli]